MAANRQLPPALSVCKRKATCQAMRPVPTHNIQQCVRQCDQSLHIKYSNATSRWPVGDQSPSQPHKLEKFTIRLKSIRWNTPLYNLTKNTNTFPLFAENDKVEHSSI